MHRRIEHSGVWTQFGVYEERSKTFFQELVEVIVKDKSFSLGK